MPRTRGPGSTRRRLLEVARKLEETLDGAKTLNERAKAAAVIARILRQAEGLRETRRRRW
jgi:hypothetical protein